MLCTLWEIIASRRACSTSDLIYIDFIFWMVKIGKTSNMLLLCFQIKTLCCDGLLKLSVCAFWACGWNIIYLLYCWCQNWQNCFGALFIIQSLDIVCSSKFCIQIKKCLINCRMVSCYNHLINKPKKIMSLQFQLAVPSEPLITMYMEPFLNWFLSVWRQKDAMRCNTISQTEGFLLIRQHLL